MLRKGSFAEKTEDGRPALAEAEDRLKAILKDSTLKLSHHAAGRLLNLVRVRLHPDEKLHELAEVTEQTFVVAGVPDEKKGERLIVLHKLKEPDLQACLEKLAQSDLPNLWKPRPDQFFRIETFPYLGTGKLDLRKIKELALERAAAAS